jgi:nicotinate-nucleotide adenylyltransferase
MKKTGIMGGTFDPIHNGHLIIASYAMEQLGLDEVWFMTSGNPPHKRGKRTDARIRHEMTELAISGSKGFVPCDYEVKRKEYSYSALTMEQFNKTYPDRSFYFIIGQDSLHDLNKWYHPEMLLKYASIAVYPRASEISLDEELSNAEKSLKGVFERVDAPLFGVSSTEIRKRISEGKSVRYMIPDAVDKYIAKKGLYRHE